MSVTEHTPITQATGDGSTTVVAFDWPVLSAPDMRVKVAGVELTLNVDFTVQGVGSGTGGTVTFAVAPASGASISLYRSSALQRIADYQTAGDFKAAVVNADFDRQWLVFMEILNGSRGSLSSLRVPSGEVLSQLPAKAFRLGKTLTFDPVTGEPLLTTPTSGSTAELVAQLASVASAAYGAGQIGYDGTLAYVAHSVGGRFAQQKTIKDFGATADGVADDSAAVQLAASSGLPVDLCGKTCRVVSKITFGVASTRFRNGRLLWAGPNTSRLADITADNVTFEEVIFDGDNRQPRYSLVYVAANVRRPRFLGGAFRNLYGTATGSNVLNQMYGLNINPYGVLGFQIDGTEFHNLRKVNDGTTATVTVGFGFVGGVCFNTEDGSDPSAAQPTPSQGKIRGCDFDLVGTILAAGLSDNDVSIYDDGDAIRTVQGTGAKRLYVDISDCTFRRVSKRAVKLRASGGTFKDSTIYASLGAYSMSTPVDLVNGCWADNINIVTSAALPVLKVATLANAGDTTDLPLAFGVRGIECGHAKVGVELVSDGAVAMAGMECKSVHLAACTGAGFICTGTAPSSQTDMVIDDLRVVGSGNNCRAIQASAAADSTGGWVITGLRARNADVKIEGTNNTLRGMRLRVTSSAFAGYSATAGLLEFGSGKGMGGKPVIEDCVIDASGINTGYLSASRPYLVLCSADNLGIKGLEIIVPDGLSNSYAHFDGIGDDAEIVDFSYRGAGFCRHGSLIASSRWTVKNATRHGSGACSVPFWTLASAAQHYEFSHITDFRPTSQPTINSSTATNGIASVINTRSTHGSGGVAGVAKTAAVNTF